MIFSILNTVMLLGAIQGIILSLYIFLSKKHKTLSNLFLALLIVSFSYNIIQSYLHITGIITKEYYFKYFYIPFSSVFMTLFYLYVKYYLYHLEKFQKKDYLFFIPFINDFFVTLIEKIVYALGFYNVIYIKKFDYIKVVLEYFNIFYSIALIILSIKLINRYKKQKKNNFQLIQVLSIRWLKILSYIFLIMGVYWLIPFTIEVFFGNNLQIYFYYFLWIALSILIYLLGHFGIYHFGIFQEQKSIHKFSISRTALIQKDTASNIKNENLIEFEKFIKEERNFLDANLSLESVAEKLNINKSYLSRLINSDLEKNFNDYINELRIEEAKTYLEQTEFENYTLLAIGLEAGFNSKTAFNSAFKKFTGVTPSEYKKSKKHLKAD